MAAVHLDMRPIGVALLLACGMTCSAQFDFPFPTEHAIWTQWVDHWAVNGPAEYLGRSYQSYYMTEADTMIGGMAYAQVFDKFGSYTAAVRDELGRVLVVPAGQQDEYLLYDFTIPAGVDTTLLVWTIHDMEPWEANMHGAGPIGPEGRIVVQGEGFDWIEGIGCEAGLFMESWINLSGWWPGLQCMSVDGQLLYPDTLLYPGWSGPCEIVTEIPQLRAKGPTLYPNPATDELVLEGLPGDQFRFTILSADGRLVLQGAVRGPRARLATTALPMGCYTLRVEGADYRFNATFIKAE